MDKSPESITYQTAYKNNAFGIYNSRKTTTHKVLWGATIKPVAFIHKKDRDLLDADTILIIIANNLIGRDAAAIAVSPRLFCCCKMLTLSAESNTIISC